MSSTEYLSFILDSQNSEELLMLNGEEEKEKKKKNFIIRETTHTARVLLRNKDGEDIAGIRFVKKGKKRIISEIYTKPEYRRQKAMVILFDFTEKHFGELTHSKHLSDDAKNFIKHLNKKSEEIKKRSRPRMKK